MNDSPESRLLTRYGITLVLVAIGIVIAPRAYANGTLMTVVLVSSVVSTRVIVVAPRRFALRGATRGFQLVWYLLVVEVVLLAVAFVLALNVHGSVAGAWTALLAAAGLEIFVHRREVREHLRVGLMVPVLEPRSSDELGAFVGERSAPSERALKNALAEIYTEIPTVLRAYLAAARSDDGPERRVLALRFAFPWVDDQAVHVAQIVFGRMFAAGESLDVLPLNDASEGRVRAVAEPFYKRPPTVRQRAP